MSNDKFPAFSVLLSIYKDEEPAFLDKALEIIEDQTVKPNQIVAVVDGPIGSELDAVLKEHQNQNTDIYTIVRYSLGFDIQIAFETIRIIFTGDGAR